MKEGKDPDEGLLAGVTDFLESNVFQFDESSLLQRWWPETSASSTDVLEADLS